MRRSSVCTGWFSLAAQVVDQPLGADRRAVERQRALSGRESEARLIAAGAIYTINKY